MNTSPTPGRSPLPGPPATPAPAPGLAAGDGRSSGSVPSAGAGPEFFPPPLPVPPVAGLCTLNQAIQPGMAVEECVAWLKRLHTLFRDLHLILVGRITSEPCFELKTAFSLHAWLCAEQATALRNRVSELREPPLGLDLPPEPGLAWALDELRAAPGTALFCTALYGAVLPTLRQSLVSYCAVSQPLADAPSLRLVRHALLDLDDMLDFGRRLLLGWEQLAPPPCDPSLASTWTGELQQAFSASGLLAGTHRPPGADPSPDSTIAPQPPLPARRFSQTPWQFDPLPRRDARFRDPYNGGVNPEAFLYDPAFLARDKTLMLFYKRLREIDVPEMMASILVESRDKPWEFLHAMTRQLWDEARHSLMGQVGFVALGIDWTQIPVNFTWSLNLNTQLTAQERHAVLFFIEQGLMPRTGKRFEWEVAQQSGVPLAATFQDFDWADEVLHAQIGREWYVTDFPDLNHALAYGDRCWSRVMSHWREYLDQGLTQHHNWWPDVYRQACQVWNTPPDPGTLAFRENYSQLRADLKEFSSSD